MNGRPQFTRELTVEAARLVKERGVSVAEAARDPEPHENPPRRWCGSSEPTRRLLSREQAWYSPSRRRLSTSARSSRS